MSRLAILLLLPALAGCTAVKAGYSLVDAHRAYEEAVEAGAEKRAVYQLTLAHEYLMKAHEEDGYADYGAVDKLCRKAKEASLKAVADAEAGGVGPNAEELPENLNAPATEEQGEHPLDLEEDP